jgi:hypothetical protein
MRTRRQPKGGAFNYATMCNMQSRFGDLMQRLRATFTPPRVTNEHLLHMFVRPEHHNTVTEIIKIARCDTITYVEYEVPEMDVELTFWQTAPVLFITPKYAGNFYTGECPDVMNDIISWAKTYQEFEQQVRLGQHAIEGLNSRCKTPLQMRFHLDSFNVLSGKNLEFKVPQTIPTLPTLLKEALRNVDTLVAKALLLESLKSNEANRIHIRLKERVRVPWD